MRFFVIIIKKITKEYLKISSTELSMIFRKIQFFLGSFYGFYEAERFRRI